MFAGPSHSVAEESDETAPLDDGTATLDSDGSDSGTDAGVAEREERSMKYDGLSADETAKLREGAEKKTFQAEVSRMMKVCSDAPGIFFEAG